MSDVHELVEWFGLPAAEFSVVMDYELTKAMLNIMNVHEGLIAYEAAHPTKDPMDAYVLATCYLVMACFAVYGVLASCAGDYARYRSLAARKKRAQVAANVPGQGNLTGFLRMWIAEKVSLDVMIPIGWCGVVTGVMAGSCYYVSPKLPEQLFEQGLELSGDPYGVGLMLLVSTGFILSRQACAWCQRRQARPFSNGKAPPGASRLAKKEKRKVAAASTVNEVVSAAATRCGGAPSYQISAADGPPEGPPTDLEPPPYENADVIYDDTPVHVSDGHSSLAPGSNPSSRASVGSPVPMNRPPGTALVNFSKPTVTQVIGALTLQIHLGDTSAATAAKLEAVLEIYHQKAGGSGGGRGVGKTT